MAAQTDSAPGSATREILATTLGTVGSFAPTVSSEQDPIFALIEAERQAWDALGTAIDHVCTAEEALTAQGFDWTFWVPGRTCASLVESQLRRALSAAAAADDAADAAHEAALAALFSSTPTTSAGALAMLDVFEAREMDNVGGLAEGFLAGLFNTLRAVLSGKA